MVEHRSPTRLRMVRQAFGLSQADLARAAGVSRSIACRIELGQLAPWPKFRRDAATALGVDEARLFGEKPE